MVVALFIAVVVEFIIIIAVWLDGAREETCSKLWDELHSQQGTIHRLRSKVSDMEIEKATTGLGESIKGLSQAVSCAVCKTEIEGEMKILSCRIDAMQEKMLRGDKK
jgi:hypothetical protein